MLRFIDINIISFKHGLDVHVNKCKKIKIKNHRSILIKGFVRTYINTIKYTINDNSSIGKRYKIYKFNKTH